MLVTGSGSEGDTRPFLALAAGMADRGHAAAVCLDRSGADSAARLGLPYRELDGDFRAHLSGGRAEEALARATRDGGLTGLAFFGEIARAHTEQWVCTVETAIDEHRPDVVVGSGLTVWAAQTAAESRGVRFAASAAFPLAPTRAFPSLVSPGVPPAWLNVATHHVATAMMSAVFHRPVAAARRRRGLGRFRAVWDDVPVIYGYSPVLLPTPRDWRSNVAVCGDWHLDDPGWTPPADLVAFLDAGEPPVYVGFGSMVGTEPLLRAVLDGLAGRRVVVNPGWSGVDPAAWGHDPEVVHVVGQTPHSWLLPRCAAAVHHCGAGTTHAVTRAGIPSIPVPFAADQPFWARRLVQLGVASAPLDRRHVTPGDIRSAGTILDDVRVWSRAHRIADRLAREDSVDAAITHLTTWSTPASG
ncbi:putative glycosyltransferase [Mobilicoccus pelagius NBRC 104925]|uniref:Putative glycosyltransferase n=1 Tax=Mobilicoccus pelagius NBRC 104925 TaxID=1089455 RepID=H5UR14_9MICO|nr:putative glycosyltransferase [Mobilicoccus pelagius NBRC 104925]